MKERDFQREVINEIRRTIPDVMVLKNDPTYLQGVPDLLILYRDKWAALECKISFISHIQPNQQYYVNRMSEMSYAAFIYPENKKEILEEMYTALEVDVL